MIRRAKASEATKNLNNWHSTHKQSRPEPKFIDDFEMVPVEPNQQFSAVLPTPSVIDIINQRETEIELEISRIKAMIVDAANLELELKKIRAAKSALMGYHLEDNSNTSTQPEQKQRKRRTKKQIDETAVVTEVATSKSSQQLELPLGDEFAIPTSDIKHENIY